MAYIPYGKLKMEELSVGDIVYYKGKVKFPNSREYHYEDTMLMIEEIGEYRSQDDEGEMKDGTYIHGQAMSGSLMGAYIDNVTLDEIAEP